MSVRGRPLTQDSLGAPCGWWCWAASLAAWLPSWALVLCPSCSWSMRWHIYYHIQILLCTVILLYIDTWSVHRYPVVYRVRVMTMVIIRLLIWFWLTSSPDTPLSSLITTMGP